MGKNKAKRFAENLTFKCMVQPEFSEIFHKNYKLKGAWNSDFFANNNKIILELGCGRGEYTVGLGRMYPDRNFLGIDVKGARMWRGGRSATDEGLTNVGFLRTRIEFIDSFFARNEVDEVWITFPDPQLKKKRAAKRLTSPDFLKAYSAFLKPNGYINLKTDSLFLHRYTRALIESYGITPEIACEDIYAEGAGMPADVTSLQTTYENIFLSDNKPITYLRFCMSGRSDFPPFEHDGEIDEELKELSRF